MPSTIASFLKPSHKLCARLCILGLNRREDFPWLFVNKFFSKGHTPFPLQIVRCRHFLQSACWTRDVDLLSALSGFPQALKKLLEMEMTLRRAADASNKEFACRHQNPRLHAGGGEAPVFCLNGDFSSKQQKAKSPETVAGRMFEEYFMAATWGQPFWKLLRNRTPAPGDRHFSPTFAFTFAFNRSFNRRPFLHMRLAAFWALDIPGWQEKEGATQFI